MELGLVFDVWGLVVAFLPDEHANQEEGQGDADHRCWRGESPMGFGQFDLIQFLEEFSGIELFVVLRPETLDCCVDALGVGSTEKLR